MRYCLDARSATIHFPGIGRYVSNLAREMAIMLDPGESLLLITDKKRASPWRLPGESQSVQLVATTASLFGLTQQWQIPRLLRRFHVDLYHSPYYMMPYLLPAPVVATIHDLIPQLMPRYFSPSTRFLSNLFKRLAIVRATAILVDSETTKRDVLSYYSPPVAKISAIPLAADERFRPQAEAEVQRVRRTYDLPEQYILYLGSNKPHKNLVSLVRAYARVANAEKGRPPLLIAGTWDNRYHEVKQASAELQLGQAVRFLGAVTDDDVPALLGGALIFVFPSMYEGFGLPVLEAMACGTAVACANTSSLTELGSNAVVYFDPQDVANMAETISLLLVEDRRRVELSRRGLARAARYSWSKTAGKTLSQYRQLASH